MNQHDLLTEARMVLRRHPNDQALYLANMHAHYGLMRSEALRKVIEELQRQRAARGE